jgi:predicted enzyme related to lactoylglutathione lyase
MDPVSHFEIPFTDKDRAQKFYQQVFGWQFVDVPDMTYSMAITSPVDESQRPRKPGTINGGMYQRGEGASDRPVVVLLVPSCEQRVEEVKAAGGSVVVPPNKVGDMGIYAQVKDTEDNIIGLWQSLKQPAG